MSQSALHCKQDWTLLLETCLDSAVPSDASFHGRLASAPVAMLWSKNREGSSDPEFGAHLGAVESGNG